MNLLALAEKLIEEGKPLPMDLVVELMAMGIELEMLEIENGEQ